jgi:outer membrane protein OmpA-like peptidoglycan-associated protein
MKKLAMLVAALTLTTSGLAAQHAHQYEIGAFGSYTRYDPAFGLAKKVGGGARFGYFFGNVVSLEGDVLFQPSYRVPGTSSKVEPIIGSASLVFNLLSRVRNVFYVLGGYSRLDYGNSGSFKFTDDAMHGAVGDRIFLTNRVALRVEARAYYTPTTQSSFGTKAATHWAGTLGLSFFELGAPGRPATDGDKDGVVDSKDKCPDTPPGGKVDERGCPIDIDTDGDGVPDRLDQCPDTPTGAHVDTRGCPTDADADGVPDGLDQCPNTPAGATVDPRGCPSDSDNDGVPDGGDRCPNTPIGAAVDPTGCPSDSDQDGVPDGIDRCPNTPPGSPVDSTGCPIGRDADGDGVPDSLDQCPDTPSGTTVDGSGCPVPGEIVRAQPGDEDGDGVVDTLDKCPRTPAGAKVDVQGCIVLFAPPAGPAQPGAPARATLILTGVNFETGRSSLKPESFAVLDQVAASLVANPEIRIEIAGYTDSSGSLVLNRRLSVARADRVRAYLASKGVRPSRMIARGYGPAYPIAPNTTAAGRTQNRRVELHKLP